MEHPLSDKIKLAVAGEIEKTGASAGIRRSKCIRYTCLNGHQVFCETDLSFTLCPACLRVAGVVVEAGVVTAVPLRGTFDGKMVLIDSERRQHVGKSKKEALNVQSVGTPSRFRKNIGSGNSGGSRSGGRFGVLCAECAQPAGFCECGNTTLS